MVGVRFKVYYLLMLNLGVLTEHAIHSDLARLNQTKVFILLEGFE